MTTLNNSTYLDSVIDAFGLSSLPEAVRNSLIEEIDVIIFRSVLFRVLNDLDETDKDELHDILENAGDNFEKPFSFLKTKVKNLDKIIKEEIEKTRTESVNLMEQFV